MGLEIKDLVGLSQPMTKLIEVVSSAIGAGYRPRAIRNEAEAKAYEILTLSRAEAEAEQEKCDSKLSSALARVEQIAQENPELAARAKQRLLMREIEGQLNIEAIAEHAYFALPPSVSEEPISSDWRRKFFLEAENVCESDMQFLWGKVLAGEIATPGFFSLRTLDALRNISKAEAELFRKACSLAMADGWIAVPGHDLNSALVPYGLTYGDILSLRDIGLLMDGDNIHKDFSPANPVPGPQEHNAMLLNNGQWIQLSGQGLAGLRITALLFTKVGRELQRLIDPSADDEYLHALGNNLRARGIVAKRGISTPQDGNTSVITFEQDL